MNATPEHREPRVPSLTCPPLAGRQARIFAAARTAAAGDRVWRERKIAEARDLCALSSLAPRLTIGELRTETDLIAVLHLAMPVPCWPGTAGQLQLGERAVLGVKYPREVLFRSLPGTAFVQVLRPLDTFHPNVSEGAVQVLCLGAKLPAGIRLTELVLMSYRALTLQEHTLDERDPAGIFRPEAARFFQANTQWLPLTNDSFRASPAGEFPHRG